jgi:hypothetical protein
MVGGRSSTLPAHSLKVEQGPEHKSKLYNLVPAVPKLKFCNLEEESNISPVESAQTTKIRVEQVAKHPREVKFPCNHDKYSISFCC